MKKLLTLISSCLMMYAYADTSPSLATITSQINALQQSILQRQQSSASDINDLQAQLNKLQTAVTQLQSPDFQSFTWAVSNGTNLPANAFVAARNGNTPLYICQANYTRDNSYDNSTAIDPGVVTPQGCVITYGGQAFLAPTYSVLVSTSTGGWVDGQKVQTQQRRIEPLMLTKASGADSSIGQGAATTPSVNQPTPLYNQLAVVGGQESGQNVFICRASINGQYFLGKVTNNTCNLAAGSKEGNWPVYQVLLVRQPS